MPTKPLATKPLSILKFVKIMNYRQSISIIPMVLVEFFAILTIFFEKGRQKGGRAITNPSVAATLVQSSSRFGRYYRAGRVFSSDPDPIENSVFLRLKYGGITYPKKKRYAVNAANSPWIDPWAP